LNSELITESLERLADELRPIIMENLLWHTKAVDHEMFDKLDQVRCLHLLQRDCLCSFWKV